MSRLRPAHRIVSETADTLPQVYAANLRRSLRGVKEPFLIVICFAVEQSHVCLCGLRIKAHVALLGAAEESIDNFADGVVSNVAAEGRRFAWRGGDRRDGSLLGRELPHLSSVACIAVRRARGLQVVQRQWIQQGYCKPITTLMTCTGLPTL